MGILIDEIIYLDLTRDFRGGGRKDVNLLGFYELMMSERVKRFKC